MIPRPAYPSDLTDAQQARLAHCIPAEKLAGTPGRTRTYTNRDLLVAILYQLRVGGDWRSLSHDMPNGKSVLAYFRLWSANNVIERVLETLRSQRREQVGKKPTPSVVILDSQSANSTHHGGEK